MITDQYFAGLFDGEGYINAHAVRRPNGHIDLYTRVGIGMVTEILIRQVQAQYGGNVHIYNPQCKYPTRKIVFKLNWEGSEDQISVLDKLIPYLIIKREQAKLARWWCYNINPRRLIRINEARGILKNELEVMRDNPLVTAESAIKKIEDCIHFRDSSVVQLPTK
jgi:hypothetical protein